MRVLVPSPLRSYTGGRPEVQGAGGTLAACLDGLDAAFPGMRFRMIDEQGRIREHIRIFVNGELVRRLDQPLCDEDEVHILCALSGG